MCRTGTNFSEQRSKHTFSVQGPSSLDEQEAWAQGAQADGVDSLQARTATRVQQAVDRSFRIDVGNRRSQL